jgi:hypothetical protein
MQATAEHGVCVVVTVGMAASGDRGRRPRSPKHAAAKGDIAAYRRMLASCCREGLTHVAGVNANVTCVIKPTTNPPSSAARGRLPTTHTGTPAVCGQAGDGGGGGHWWVNTHIHGARQLVIISLVSNM